HCADFYKRQTRQREEKEALSVELKELASSSDQELFEIKINRLSTLLNKLEPDERMILLMKYQDDVSIKELSRILELNDSAVKMRLSRARQKIIDLNKALFSENIY
ncbi:MAG: sigma-70 family RNA polymerase sigma factor, partial [Imperialibacter sp.]